MKKFWTLMLALSMAFSCSLGLAACGETPKQPTGDESQSGEKLPDAEQNKPSEKEPSEENKGEQVPDSRPDPDPSVPTNPEAQKPQDPEETEPPKQEEPLPEDPEEPEIPSDDPEKEPDEGQDDPKDDEKDEPEKDEGEEKEDEKHTHSFSEWVSDDKGNHFRTCACGEKQTEKCTIKKKTVSPTCVEDGYTLNYCTKCSYSFQTNPVKSNGEHVWTYTFTGTDRNNSTHTRTCSACGETQPAEKCKFDNGVLVPATCTEDGYYKFTCSVCNNQITSSFRSGVAAPTRKGHNLSTVWTPDEDKMTHSQKCQNSGCDYKVTKDCTITTTEVAPTCGKEGSKTSVCKTCNRNTVEKIEKLPHTFGPWQPDSSLATKHKHTCSVCNQVELRDCTFGEPVTQEPTCTTGGKITKTCSECKRVSTEFTKATGHKLTGELTSNLNGHTGKCSVCNKDVTEKHVYGGTNFCTVCRFDGLSYNFKGGIYVEARSSGASSDNSLHKTATTIYIAESPFTNSKDLKTYAIGARAFAGNPNLRDIYIPKCIFLIDATAFDGCTNLTIHYQGTVDSWNGFFENSKNPVDGTNIKLVANDYKYPAEEETISLYPLPEAILPEKHY